MTTRTEYGRLLSGLRRARKGDRRTHMMLLADAALDRGDHDLAAGWRWLAENGKWPLAMNRSGGWYEGYGVWGAAPFGGNEHVPARNTKPPTPHVLPAGLLRKLRRRVTGDGRKRLPSFPEAMDATARLVGEWYTRGGAETERENAVYYLWHGVSPADVAVMYPSYRPDPEADAAVRERQEQGEARFRAELAARHPA
jgi:hypothetical protein